MDFKPLNFFETWNYTRICFLVSFPLPSPYSSPHSFSSSQLPNTHNFPTPPPTPNPSYSQPLHLPLLHPSNPSSSFVYCVVWLGTKFWRWLRLLATSSSPSLWSPSLAPKPSPTLTSILVMVSSSPPLNPTCWQRPNSAPPHFLTPLVCMW